MICSAQNPAVSPKPAKDEIASRQGFSSGPRSSAESRIVPLRTQVRQYMEAATLSQAEGNSDLLLIGKLIVEQGLLEKRIGRVCDELARRASVYAKVANLLIAKPERLVFKGETVAEEFTGEHAIDRDAMAIDSLLADLRVAIVEKNECAKRLAELGIDPGQMEDERNQRASRALHHPAKALATDPKPRGKGFGFYPRGG
jgi:hypothetical protein